MAKETANVASAVPAVSPTPAPVADMPATAAAAPRPVVSVRFAEPAYRGKPDASNNIARPNVADATLAGVFGDLPLCLAGLTLNKNGSQIVIYMPKTGPIQGSPAAIQPAMIPAPDGVETESGMVLAPGARGAVERLHDAIRNAWADANKTTTTAWGKDFPLAL